MSRLIILVFFTYTNFVACAQSKNFQKLFRNVISVPSLSFAIAINYIPQAHAGKHYISISSWSGVIFVELVFLYCR